MYLVTTRTCLFWGRAWAAAWEVVAAPGSSIGLRFHPSGWTRSLVAFGSQGPLWPLLCGVYITLVVRGNSSWGRNELPHTDSLSFS